MSQFPRYMLAYFDTNHKNHEWYIINYPFIIEHKDTEKITGLFLKDTWFNYLVHEKSNIHFMVILVENTQHYGHLINTMNLNHGKYNMNSEPSKNDIQAINIKHFILDNDTIVEYMKIMKEKSMERMNIQIYNTTSTLSFCINYYKEELTISLPSFDFELN